MKFFAISALATIASAQTYYGGARLGTGLTGLSTGITGLSGLSTGITGLGYNNLGYRNTLGFGVNSLGYGVNSLGYGVNTLAVPAVNKVAVVAQPAIAATGLNYGLGYNSGYTLGAASVAPLAVQSVHHVQHYDVPSGGNINPISVEIDANPIPINMVFRSASSQLAVQQAHQNQAGTVQESASEDEAHVLKHSVVKPVHQEVREVITPFRKITQEVQPVQEEIQTLVARGTAGARVLATAAPVVSNVVAQPVLSHSVVAQPVVNTVAVAQPVATLGVAKAYGTGLLGVNHLGYRNTLGYGVNSLAVPAVNTIGTVGTVRALNTYAKEY